jgi:serine/threonine protein kinase
LHLAAQAASALEAAHQKGIVHRDLKPENLFLIPDPAHPGQQRVKVLDFGIAKLRGTFSKGDSMKTRTGSLMGTPPYMSPEQCRGISDAMDHRSDIYSFGIILYEMAVGRPPFVSEGFGEILMMHMQTPPAPPSSLCPDIPPAFEYTILRALAKEPGQRFSSMGELLAALTSKTCPPLPLSDNSGGSSRKETLVLPEAGPGQAEYPEPESQDGILNSAEESAEREAVRTALVYKRRNVMIGGALAGVAVIALVGYLVFGGSKHPARSPGPLADTKKASPSEIVVPPAQPVVPPVVNKPVLASPDPAAKPEPEPAKPVAKRGPADDRPAESRRHSRPKPVERPTSKPAGDDSVEKW